MSQPHPVSQPRPAPGHDGEPLDLPTAIVAGLQALGNLWDLAEGVRDGRLEGMLRASLDAHRPPRASSATVASSAAVRTACAHLGAGELEDAYLALCTAYDFLPRRPPRAW